MVWRFEALASRMVCFSAAHPNLRWRSDSSAAVAMLAKPSLDPRPRSDALGYFNRQRQFLSCDRLNVRLDILPRQRTASGHWPFQFQAALKFHYSEAVVKSLQVTRSWGIAKCRVQSRGLQRVVYLDDEPAR
jgi:hypothetical protein